MCNAPWITFRVSTSPQASVHLCCYELLCASLIIINLCTTSLFSWYFFTGITAGNVGYISLICMLTVMKEEKKTSVYAFHGMTALVKECYVPTLINEYWKIISQLDSCA